MRKIWSPACCGKGGRKNSTLEVFPKNWTSCSTRLLLQRRKRNSVAAGVRPPSTKHNSHGFCRLPRIPYTRCDQAADLSPSEDVATEEPAESTILWIRTHCWLSLFHASSLWDVVRHMFRAASQREADINCEFNSCIVTLGGWLGGCDTQTYVGLHCGDWTHKVKTSRNFNDHQLINTSKAISTTARKQEVCIASSNLILTLCLGEEPVLRNAMLSLRGDSSRNELKSPESIY